MAFWTIRHAPVRPHVIFVQGRLSSDFRSYPAMGKARYCRSDTANDGEFIHVSVLSVSFKMLMKADVTGRAL